MKKLFLFLLRKYSKTESQRMEIYQELWYKTKHEYDAITAFENVYNMNVEVLMSNPFFKRRVELGDVKYLKWIKKGLEKSFDSFVKWTMDLREEFHIPHKLLHYFIQFFLVPNDWKTLF